MKATAAVSHTARSAKLQHVGNKVLFSSRPQPLRYENTSHKTFVKVAKYSL